MTANTISYRLNDGEHDIAAGIVSPKQFKTGSVGFYTNGKVEMGGRRYQFSLMLVEIGSKPEEVVTTKEVRKPRRK